MAVLLIIVFVLSVILLIPIQVKAKYGDGKWSLTANYLWFSLLRRGSKDEPEPEPQPVNEDQPIVYEAEKPVDEAAAVPAAEPTHETVSESEPPAEEALSAEESPEIVRPDEEDDDKAEDDAEEDAEQPKKKKGYFARLKPHSLKDGIALGKDILAALSPSLKLLLRHFHFRHTKLYLAVASDDAAKTAQLYGKLCAASYNLLSALQCRTDIQIDEFRVLADFYGSKLNVRVSTELRVSPAVLLLTLIILAAKFFWRTWRRFRREDKEEKLRARAAAKTAAA